MAHQLTNAEVENKVAFLVQLHALLSQVSSFVSGNALGSAQKAKLSDLRGATETWLKDVGTVGAPRPSIASASQAPRSPVVEAPPPSPPAAAAAATESSTPASAEATSNGAAASATPPTAPEATHTVKEAATAPAAAPTTTTAATAVVLGTSSSFTADIAVTHAVTDGRNLVDLVGYLRLLFDNDVPERMRLQAFGKSLVRLLMVRCCSTIMASLQHVVHHTYTPTAPLPEEEAASVTHDAAEVEESFPSAAAPDAEEKAAADRTMIFVELAKEINVATKALLGCVQLITTNAVPSDPVSARFPVQLCIDVSKQTRRALLYFQSRIEKEELFLLRAHILATCTAEAHAPPEDVDAVQDALQREPAEDVAAHVRLRADAVETLWGPSLAHSVRHIGDVVDPAVRFLVSVAGVRAEGAAAAMVGLKKDAAHDLFSLCGVASADATPTSSGGAVRTTTMGNGAGGPLARPSSMGELASFSAGAAAAASPVSVSSVTSPAWRAAAGEVLTHLGSSYTADYLAAVARCCGDNSEGQLLATRLLADMLDHVSTHDVALLRCVLRASRWSAPLYDGILNCVVSIQPGVLAAGLDALRLLTVNCPAELGQEVGYLYSNVVLRLLESSNSPHYVKRTIVLHFLTTLFGPSSTVSASAAVAASGGGNGEASRDVPLILHLYRLYDLDIHAHQLNFVQQFTSALSRIVRAAPKDDFLQDAVVQEQLRRQQEASGSGAVSDAATGSSRKVSDAAAATADGTATTTATTTSAGAGGDSRSPSTAALTASLASLSLPAMALHGLVRIVELLTTQAPPEEETGRDVLAALPTIQIREQKLKEQQQVDLFNASPKKAVYKMFAVSAEENAVPPDHSDFASQWDHTRIPPVPSAETAAKVEAVVDFLTSISSLDPEAVAEFLTTPAVFPLHVCTAYLRRLPLAGRSVLEAISELLMRVQLPKEGQRIERLLEYFSAVYYDANNVPGIDSDVFPFKNDTAVFIVVVATVMLNTNIHNPSAGMRLDLKSFRGQLKRCNNDESFRDAFVDDIFFSISTHPLESIKSVAVDTSATADSASRGAFDIFFVSQEEKRQLAFGVERQRMVSETRQLLQLRTEQDEHLPMSSQWWCAAARDFFLSTWSAVCAVFGPAMYEGTSAPSSVLLQCVRGLQSLLCTAAAFDLSTECTVTLLTLLRMAESTPVRAHCRRAVLVVAATSYAAHFPVRCWVAVCQLMLELRLSSTSAAPPLVEDVFTRMESLTRLSVEVEEKRAAAVAAVGTCAAGSGVTGSDNATEAVHRMLEGVMMTLGGYAVGDVANMSAALILLRRALEFSRIIHGRRATDVVYYVNLRDFTDVVVPAYIELIQKHRQSDDGLQVLFECLVELLCTMWLSYSTRRVAVPMPEKEDDENGDEAAPSSQQQQQQRTGKGKGPASITVDTAPAGFARCFGCLRSIYDVTLAGAADGSATLLQMHVLQAVKEIVTRTAHAAEVTSEAQHLSLYTMVSAWQLALYPLGMALCDRKTTATEAGSLALLVLRKLVALSGGTGSTSSDRLPPPVRAALLWLLAQLAYMGGMCGDIDGAQVCVALLSSICTTTLAASVTASSPAAWSAGGPSSPLAIVAEGEMATIARALAARDALTQRVVSAMEAGPDYVVRQTLSRLGLLLRCEREQTRWEVVHQLRTLTLQMRPAQVQAFAVDLCEVVLEGAIGHAAHHHKTPITHTSLLPFLVYRMPVPSSMRRCSRTAFRATLPAALGFLASELLSGLSGEVLAVTAEGIMQRCLVPILLSPNSPYQSRFLAIRAVSQCTAVALPQSSEQPRPRLAQCVLDCISLCLFAVQVPLTAVVPPTSNFVGRRWLAAPTASSAAVAEWGAYGAAAAHAQHVMDTAEPEWVVRGVAANTSAQAAAAAEEDVTAPPPSRGSRSGAGVAGLLPDEPLIEYVNLLAQVLAGVPKELQGVVTSAMAEDESTAAVAVAPPSGADMAEWRLPRTSVLVLLHLTLRAAGTLFALLWRVNHPYEVEQYALQGAELGRETPSLMRNSGLLPHAAIRSVLQCYLELAMRSTAYPTADVLATTTDIIEGIRQVQAAAQPAAGTPAPSAADTSANTTAVGGASSSLAADSAALQRLSPQEQQHVRTCNSGMYQQLAAVLGYLVRLLTGQSGPTSAPVSSSALLAAPGWQHRREAFESMATHPQFFSSLVSLLTPTAGTLIVTVRDYFAWYIANANLPTVAGPATPKREDAAVGEEAVGKAADGGPVGDSRSSNGHVRAAAVEAVRAEGGEEGDDAGEESLL